MQLGCHAHVIDDLIHGVHDGRISTVLLAAKVWAVCRQSHCSTTVDGLLSLLRRVCPQHDAHKQGSFEPEPGSIWKAACPLMAEGCLPFDYRTQI